MGVKIDEKNACGIAFNNSVSTANLKFKPGIDMLFCKLSTKELSTDSNAWRISPAVLALKTNYIWFVISSLLTGNLILSQS